jgi:adenylosuccinate lyase
VHLKDLFLADEKVRELLTPEELDACFDPRRTLRNVDLIFDRLGL